jgi:hypothetical protein
MLLEGWPSPKERKAALKACLRLEEETGHSVGAALGANMKFYFIVYTPKPLPTIPAEWEGYEVVQHEIPGTT